MPQLWRQRSDERAFFGQKRFGSEKERVIPGTFFMAVYRQNCGAHCQRAWRFVPRRFYTAECCERVLIPSQTKPRQPERCPGQPVLRFLFDKDISFALCCFSLFGLWRRVEFQKLEPFPREALI